MIPDPFQTFSGCLHFRKVVVAAALGADDGRDHGGYVHQLPVGHGADPAGGAAVDMSVSHACAAGAHADEGSVSASAEDGRARDKPQFRRGLFGQDACLFGRRDDFRKMFHADAEGSA